MIEPTLQQPYPMAVGEQLDFVWEFQIPTDSEMTWNTPTFTVSPSLQVIDPYLDGTEVHAVIRAVVDPGCDCCDYPTVVCNIESNSTPPIKLSRSIAIEIKSL